MELGPEDVSLLERCPHFRDHFFSQFMWHLHGNLSLVLKCHLLELLNQVLRYWDVLN